MQHLVDDVVLVISQFSTLIDVCRYSVVCKQWHRIMNFSYQSRMGHWVVGPYFLSNHPQQQQHRNKLILLEMHSDVLLSWSSGSTLYYFHSHHLIHDACCYYFLCDKYLVCAELETMKTRWYRILEWNNSEQQQQNKIIYQDCDTILVSDNHGVHVVSKSNDYYYRYSCGAIFHVLLTPNFIVVEEEEQVSVFRKPLSSTKTIATNNNNNVKRKSSSPPYQILIPHCTVPVQRSLFSLSICLSSIYNEYITRSQTDRFYIDFRPKGHPSIMFRSYDCETGSILYTYNVSSLTNFVDMSLASSDYWCVTGCTFDKSRNTYLINMRDGNAIVLRSDKALAFNPVPRVTSSVNDLRSYDKTIGFCALSEKEKTCSFYSMEDENPTELTLKWVMETEDVFRFKYRPTIQVLVLQNTMYLLAFGGPGCLLYCINITDGTLYWKCKLLEDVLNKEQNYSHFDVHIKLVALDVSQEQICISGTIKHCSFFCYLFNRKEGKINDSFTAWDTHKSNVMTVMLYQTETLTDTSGNNQKNNKKCLLM
jgi:hypothetical protein